MDVGDSEQAAATQYEALLRQLHALDRVGKFETIEADVLRDQMDVFWYRLNDQSRQRLALLAEALYAVD